MNVEQFVKLIIIFLYAVILHEYAHGWVAYRLGDSTAKNSGRLTLNPIKHIDPVGSVALPAMLFFLQSPILFGWAKPVPVNFLNLRNPRRDMMAVAVAGPLVNVVLAVIFSLFFRGQLGFSDKEVLRYAVEMNLALALFNLIPIPPLDGSRILAGLLPPKLAWQFFQIERYGFILIFILLYFGALNKVIGPMIRSVESMLGVFP